MARVVRNDEGNTTRRRNVPSPTAVAIAGLVLACGLAARGGGVAVADVIEEPTYSVVRAAPGWELRSYAPAVVAETVVDEGLDAAGNEGFRRLAGYIFGANHSAGRGEPRRSQKIAMTAPVGVAPVRIAMTAPVEQQAIPAAGGEAPGGPLTAARRYRVTFTMPRSFRLDTLPVPDDARVQLREEPARLVAAVRFAGRWRADVVDQHARELASALAAAGLRAAGPPIYARYDPPWSLPWRRRNEVLIPVEPPAAAAANPAAAPPSPGP